MINRQFFFDHAKTVLFKGSLSKSQVDGLTYILNAWEEDHSEWDNRWLAYALGTTHLETGAKMQPIHEGGGKKYFEWNYGPEGKDPSRAKKMGNTQTGDGARYHGRGFVQLTWKNNYSTLGAHLSKVFSKSINLVADPDLALEPDYAAEIMFFGMSAGTFTGKKFSDYFTIDKNGKPVKDNWVGARAIINGHDKDQVIANFGKDYYSCLSHI